MSGSTRKYFSVATRKLGIPAAAARRRVELLATLDVVQADVTLILSAVDLIRLHDLAFWDALIVRAAQAAGCRTLLTEDLQHGQLFDALRVKNMFRQTTSSV